MQYVLIGVAILIVCLAIFGTLFLRAGRNSRRGGIDEPPVKSKGITAEQTDLLKDEPTQGEVQPSDVDNALEAAGDVDVTPCEDAVSAPVLSPQAPTERPSFRSRLGRAREAFKGLVGGTRIDESSYDNLEEALLRADVGVSVSSEMVSAVRTRVKEDGLNTPEQLVDALRAEMISILADKDRALHLRSDMGPSVWMFVGVNGVGKTTTIGKVSAAQANLGRKSVLAAGDTFRAAAGEQLAMWAERSGASIVRGAEGSDPGSVIFDAVAHAASKNLDIVFADTAGRLHNKVNLMNELEKVHRIAQREPGKCTEVLLVLDATTGQNGLQQAAVFAEAVNLTGVVLTKLDGSAKGGVAFAIERQLGIPIKLVGLGEGVEDLVDFDPAEFVDALLA